MRGKFVYGERGEREIYGPRAGVCFEAGVCFFFFFMKLLCNDVGVKKIIICYSDRILMVC